MILFMSYELSNVILSPSKFVYFKEKLQCCHVVMPLLVPVEIDNTCVVITLLMSLCYPLNNSDVI